MDLNQNLPETFPGARFYLAIQASVDAILAPLGIRRRVVARGTQFINRDAWTGESFAHHLCDFFAKNPKRLPDRAEVLNLLSAANGTQCPDPQICVARMPDVVTHRVALAIIGGGYHEAWHTKYSKRTPVTVAEAHQVLDFAKPVIAGNGSFDAKMRGLLMTLHHLIEDIRIERRGNEDFPGAYQPMCDLQDFILSLENAGREKGAKIKNVTVSTNARSIMLACFRDLGLGYATALGHETFDFYRQTAPGAVALFAKGGMLEPFLEEAIGLSRDDSMGSLRVAMKIVVALWKAAQASNRKSEPEETVCPSCGAAAENLVMRSVKDAQGRKVRGRAEVECKVCGFKTQIDLPDESLDLDQSDPPEDKPRPEVEDLDEEDIGAGTDGWGDDARERARDAKRQEASTDSEEQRDPTANASVRAQPRNGGDEEVLLSGSDINAGESLADDAYSEDDGSEGGSFELSSLLPLGQEGAAQEGDESEGASVPVRTGSGLIPGAPEDEKTVAEFLQGAGGHLDLGRDPKISSLVLAGGERDGLLNHASAFEYLVGERVKELIKDLKHGEQLWNPNDPSLDEARVVREPDHNRSLALANTMIQAVNGQITSLRARFRTVFRAQEMTDVTHGVRRGRRISNRMLVDSQMELRQGRLPSRAYVTEDAKMDTSVALAVCLDQSGSMAGMQHEVAKCMMVLVDPIERVGGATMAFGFRDGVYAGSAYDYSNTYHRVAGVRYDVFKMWEEKFDHVKGRFAHTHANGGTPMADGVQFGLSALNERHESHRILAVITDGDPNRPHERVILRQLRLAKEANIHVLGIGIGSGARYVQSLFPDHVWVASVQDLPPLLMQKVTTLLDFKGRLRGQRARLDGKITKKVS